MNFLLETLRLGLWNLRLHLLRSTLTSLGIILGVAAVILMVSIGEGNKQTALRDIKQLGAASPRLRSTRGSGPQGNWMRFKQQLEGQREEPQPNGGAEQPPAAGGGQWPPHETIRFRRDTELGLLPDF